MTRPIWIETAAFHPEKRAFINCASVWKFHLVTRENSSGAALVASEHNGIGQNVIAMCRDVEEAVGLLDYLMETIEGYSHQEATRCVIWQREIRTWIEEIRELLGKDIETTQEEQ